MAKVTGVNALVYVDGTELPFQNAWSINFTRELQEARVFQAAGAASSWVEQIPGFKSWSGSLSGYYDDTDTSMYDAAVAATAVQKLLLYEDRATLTNYWYGYAWFDMSQDLGVDSVVEISGDFTGSGALLRFSQ